MQENNYTVYMHVCPNDKKYIGITKLKPNERWKNGKSYKNCVLFNRAIQKYKWENIKHVILYQGLTKEEAESKEIELIAYYKTNKKEYGYNIENGGHVNCVSEETKKKISEATKKAMQRPEVKRNMSIAQHNRISPLKGRKLSNEHKKKLSIAHQGKGHKQSKEAIEKMIKNNTRKKKIICIETNQIFESLHEADRQTNIDYRNIQRSCKNGKIAGGYHWEYYEVIK
jgi:predicted GIY-YIG superfamily endonuclease